MEPKIEILGPEQWQEYREIRLNAQKTDPQAFGESYEREIKKSEKDIREMLSESNRRAYVAKIGERIVALATYELVLPEHVEHNAKIHSVFTDPDFRERKIGYKLLQRMLEDLHNNPKIVRVLLSVGDENEAAKKMYEKLGFVQFGLATREMKVKGKYCAQAQMELVFKDKLF